MAFTYSSSTRTAHPPTRRCSAPLSPNWSTGDTIPLGGAAFRGLEWWSELLKNWRVLRPQKGET